MGVGKWPKRAAFAKFKLHARSIVFRWLRSTILLQIFAGRTNSKDQNRCSRVARGSSKRDVGQFGALSALVRMQINSAKS